MNMKFFLSLVTGVALVVFVSLPTARAKTSDDQIKSAGAIELTTELLNKMETAAASVKADEAARAEMATIKPDTDPDFAAAVKAKCPKTEEHLQSAGITADELMKATLAILACMMDENGDLAKSNNETAKANAEFVKDNKQRCDTVGGMVMAMGGGPDAASDTKKP
jgi:hypothetical protein